VSSAELILADSSALVEYYRRGGLPAAGDRVEEAIEADRLAVNGVIKTEILAFVGSEAEYERVAADFASFHWLGLGPEEFDLACRLGFKLRRHAITVPPTDLIVAASAIRAGALLIHVDAHFGHIAELSELHAEYLGAGSRT
jgi:predicted nucleic acid-binding protein